MTVKLIGARHHNQVSTATRRRQIALGIYIRVGIVGGTNPQNPCCTQRVVHRTPNRRVLCRVKRHSPRRIYGHNKSPFRATRLMIQSPLSPNIRICLDNIGFVGTQIGINHHHARMPIHPHNAATILANCPQHTAYTHTMIAIANIVRFGLNVPTVEVVNITVIVVIYAVVGYFGVVVPQISRQIGMIRLNTVIYNSYNNRIARRCHPACSRCPSLGRINIGINNAIILARIIPLPLLPKQRIGRHRIALLEQMIELRRQNSSVCAYISEHLRLVFIAETQEPNIHFVAQRTVNN